MYDELSMTDNYFRFVYELREIVRFKLSEGCEKKSERMRSMSDELSTVTVKSLGLFMNSMKILDL